MFGSIRFCLSQANKPCLSSLVLKKTNIFNYQSNIIPKTYCISEILIKRTFVTRRPCVMITLLARSYSSQRPPPPPPRSRPNVQYANKEFRNNWDKSNYGKEFSKRSGASNTALYILSFIVFFVGVSYAAVPLYRMFCAETGYGGYVKDGHDKDKVTTMKTNKEKLLTVRFNADTASSMQWNFRPQQSEVKLYAGETALAFYTAKNPTSKPIDGISTYNVLPFEAGVYFNKIQCFCFEEQRLNPDEEVDMPVFFYIDPDFLDDPAMHNVDTIDLSYCFFESKPGLVLPTYNQSKLL